MHWGCGPRPLLRGWFREDGLRGQNLNMVLTIITRKTIHNINTKRNNFQIIRQQLIDYSMLADIFKNDAAIKSQSTVNCHKCLEGKWFYIGKYYGHIFLNMINYNIKGNGEEGRIRIFFLGEKGWVLRACCWRRWALRTMACVVYLQLHSSK